MHIALSYICDYLVLYFAYRIITFLISSYTSSQVDAQNTRGANHFKQLIMQTFLF